MPPRPCSCLLLACTGLRQMRCMYTFVVVRRFQGLYLAFLSYCYSRWFLCFVLFLHIPTSKVNHWHGTSYPHIVHRESQIPLHRGQYLPHSATASCGDTSESSCNDQYPRSGLSVCSSCVTLWTTLNSLRSMIGQLEYYRLALARTNAGDKPDLSLFI